MTCNCAKLTMHGNSYCCYLPKVIDPSKMPTTFWVVVCDTGNIGGFFSQNFKNGNQVSIFIINANLHVIGSIANSTYLAAGTEDEIAKNSAKYDSRCKSCCHESSFAAGKFEFAVTSASVSQHNVSTAGPASGRK